MKTLSTHRKTWGMRKTSGKKMRGKEKRRRRAAMTGKPIHQAPTQRGSFSFKSTCVLNKKFTPSGDNWYLHARIDIGAQTSTSQQKAKGWTHQPCSECQTEGWQFEIIRDFCQSDPSPSMVLMWALTFTSAWRESLPCPCCRQGRRCQSTSRVIHPLLNIYPKKDIYNNPLTNSFAVDWNF